MRYNQPMKSADSGAISAHSDRAITVLTVAAFLSPGAWLVVTLPPQAVAQALHLFVAAVWLLFGAFTIGTLSPVPKPLQYALSALVVLAAVSLLANPFPIQQAIYDLYGEMPGVLWLLYPLMFAMAASLGFGKPIRTASSAVVFVGTALVAVMVVWRWSQGFVTTFGSPAYSVPALAPLPFMALGLARGAEGRARALYYGCAAVIAGGLAYAAAGLSALFMLAMGSVLVFAVEPGLLGVPDRARRAVRTAGVVVLLIAMLAIAIAQVPALTSVVGGDRVAGDAEQTIATRLYLWQGAQQMFLDKPLLGFGPGGYRFSAVEYYDPGVFAYIAGAGADPTAFSAPSPHSLLWESLTRIGLLGLMPLLVLFYLWGKRQFSLTAADNPADGMLRVSLSIGFAAYLFSLMVTPVHFASGLLGVVVGGFAIAEPLGAVRSGSTAGARPWLKVALVALAVALAGYGVWRGFGLTTGTISGQDLAADTASVNSAARIVAGEPLIERRVLDFAVLGAADGQARRDVAQAVDGAPGYITGFAPNLVQFAYLGMVRGEQLAVDDYSWEADLLRRAELVTPDLPSLVAEQLHLAILTGDVDALPALIARAENYAMTYPYTMEYITRAQQVLEP